MPYPHTYHRPQTLEDALRLVSRQGVNSAILAGGTQLNTALAGIDEVVDLQATGLDQLSHNGDRLSLGAMVRLQTIVDDEDAPQLLRDMARREGPNTFRHASTIGGSIVAANPESELLAALLVYDAELTIRTADGAHTVSLADFFNDIAGNLRGAILTGVSLQTGGAATHDRVARTPQDSPIVAAVARRTPAGDTRLALTGVAAHPILVDPLQLASLNPPADFRGSSHYRKQMARLLANRVLQQI